MDPHPHFDWHGLPRLCKQSSLGVCGSADRVYGSVERDTEFITYNLKNMAIVSLYGMMQNGMMAGAP
jgi:hypothetical protein